MAAGVGAFASVAVVLVVTPGPDTALVVRNTLAGGRRAGGLSALGVVSGQATWTLASAGGITALLLASTSALLALRLVGACYLVWLGLESFFRRPHAQPRPARPHRAYRQGLLSNLGNPKTALAFTSLVPQFVPREATFGAVALLGAVLAGVTLVWLLAYAALVDRVRSRLLGGRVQRALARVTGVALVALGIRIAAERV